MIHLESVDVAIIPYAAIYYARQRPQYLESETLDLRVSKLDPSRISSRHQISPL